MHTHINGNEAPDRERKLLLTGLGCATCADKMEKDISALQDVRSAALDFATQYLFLRLSASADEQALIGQIRTIIRHIEPGADVLEASSPIDAPVDAGHGKKKRLSDRSRLIRLTVGGTFFALAYAVQFISPLPEWAAAVLFVAAYISAGSGVLYKAVSNVAGGRLFDENFLMTIATLGAFAIGEFPEGAAVMLFYQVGEFFEERAVDRSRRSIAELMEIRPDGVTVKTAEGYRRVDPESAVPGDIILVQPGERVPLDGIVQEGGSTLDMAALTGESRPVDIGEGDEILSGAINQTRPIHVRVTKIYAESTVARILELVQNATSRKARTETFMTRFARFYTPVVVAGAALLALLPPLLGFGSFQQWTYRALVFLVVSCPCALVISIPLGFFGGIGGASRKGILVKGGNYLEALANVDTVIFDKTGTLTRGVFEVTAVRPFPPFSSEELLRTAAAAERFSDHPIARSIRSAWGADIDPPGDLSHEIIPGAGVRAVIGGESIAAGSGRLMQSEGIAIPEGYDDGVSVHVSISGRYAGSIAISDAVRPDAAAAVDGLRVLGVRRIAMLTGDSAAAAFRIGSALGITEIHAALLPHQKVEVLERVLKERHGGGKTVFVGDGINDAPVLARSDIGIAMGGLGSDAAIEAADIVLMKDEPSKVAEAIRIARKTRRIVFQNIALALGVKAAVLALGALGLATMWEAVFADVGVAVLAVLNAMRAMKA